MKAKVDSPKPLDEAAEMQILKSLIKQRIDAAEMFRKAGRDEQAEKEEAERALIESYLPAGASEEEIDAAIAEAMAETGVTSLKQMGVVMKATQAKLKGQDRGRKSAERKSEVQTFMTPPTERPPAPAVRAGDHEDEGVHVAGPAAGPDHVRGAGRGQRLPGPARRPDHRRHVSGGGDRHGRAARVQGLDSRREHRANRGLHRRIGGGGRDLHHPGVLPGQGLARVRFARASTGNPPR